MCHVLCCIHYVARYSTFWANQHIGNEENTKKQKQKEKKKKKKKKKISGTGWDVCARQTCTQLGTHRWFAQWRRSCPRVAHRPRPETWNTHKQPPSGPERISQPEWQATTIPQTVIIIPVESGINHTHLSSSGHHFGSWTDTQKTRTH